MLKVFCLENGTKLEVEGIFIELGAKGALELATTIGVQLDSETFTHIDCNKKQQTNITGVYAAGDIAGHPYQMAKAVGEGCVAGWEAANYALKQKRTEKLISCVDRESSSGQDVFTGGDGLVDAVEIFSVAQHDAADHSAVVDDYFLVDCIRGDNF